MQNSVNIEEMTDEAMEEGRGVSEAEVASMAEMHRLGNLHALA